jgi:arginyl-tRNA synthetase
MINAQEILSAGIQMALTQLYSITEAQIVFQKTRKEFKGDFTLVTFPWVKLSKKSPETLGGELGQYLKEHNNLVSDFNVVKGFLNISLSDEFWLEYFNNVLKNSKHDSEIYKVNNHEANSRSIMIEYSSPNTNKPLHLGHLRNNLLGYSVANILEANGHKVIKTNLINDRGIHICKSMLAWKKFGEGESPESSGMKGDHLVGKYYVLFDKAYKKEISELVDSGMTKEAAEKKSALFIEVQNMLRSWEAGDPEVVALWKTMNGWVYEGFDHTYKELGVDFDKIYYESETYLLGREIVKQGLDKGIFYKKENGSIAIDLTAEGLDEKIVLRADGTSVYITQDIGTAILRFKEYPELSQLVYIVGNEQDYHFKVLFKILDKLGYGWAKECFHLSYGMVELPEGKMKSREGTVVDADDLLQEMYNTAELTTKELGKVEGFSEAELQELYRTVGIGALKYFILKVDPKKKMMFDPKESIDFNGHTGPFIQYTYARIRSVLRKAALNFSDENLFENIETVLVNQTEKELIRYVYDFDETIREAARDYSPALIANFAYDLAKAYNRFYHEYSIMKEGNATIRKFRLQLSLVCANTIANSMQILGIHVPNRM